MSKKLLTCINEAMDLHEELREKCVDILALCQEEEGTEDVVTTINKAASSFVKVNESLEDILSAIESLKDDDGC